LTHRMRRVTIAAVGALALGGGFAFFAAQAPASVAPGGVEEFSFPSLNDYPRGGITAGSDGNIWFTESSAAAGQIGRISPDGLVTEYPILTAKPATKELPEYSYPEGIAQGPDGVLWFTDDGTNSEGEYLIGRVTLKSGEAPQIKEFPIPPKGSYPREIAEGPEGNMWFTDISSGSGVIGRITSAGAVTLYPIPTEKPAINEPEYSYPEGIAQGPNGYMWFTDAGTNDEGKSFIGRINTSTGKVEEFLVPTKNSYPHGIARSSNGNMWFTESPEVSQVGQITSAGVISEFPASTSNAPGGIALGPDGNMWFTEGYEANAVGRITGSGEVKAFPIPTRGSNPQGIARGPEGDMWFIEQNPIEVTPTPGVFYHVGRLATPFLPVSTSPPAISGTPTQGQALSTSQGSWSNGPGAFAYQWQDCDASGNNCANLAGENGVTHFLTAGDVGHTLRVVVSASNVAGSASAVSAPTAVVAAPPLPPPPPRALSRVEASMTWTFGWSRKYTVVESLIVHGVPAGGHVEVVCRGHGCPFAHDRTATVASSHSCHGSKCKSKSKSKSKSKPKPKHTGPEISLTGLFKGHHLGVGASISVSVVKSGWVGKSFVFTARSNRAPRVQIDCLAPGSTSHPGDGC
jgi:streptogramin lyase